MPSPKQVFINYKVIRVFSTYFGCFRPHDICKESFQNVFSIMTISFLSVNIFRNFRQDNRSRKTNCWIGGKSIFNIGGKLAVESFTQNYSFMRFRWRDVGNLTQALCNALLIRFYARRWSTLPICVQFHYNLRFHSVWSIWCNYW